MESAPAVTAAPDAAPPLQYRPEIDGLRAFAVIPVILFHLGVTWLPAGSMGVDVFFVISGFLITSIIKRETDEGRFSFARFWGRRVRRIGPALIVVVAATLAFAFCFLFRGDQWPIGQQGAWALLSGANLYFYWFVGNYWMASAAQSPFLHMWTLGVEEQFYLFVPFIVWGLDRLAPRYLLHAMTVLLLASLGLFLWQSHTNPEAAFYLLPSRAWELAAGSVLAIWGPLPKGRWWWLLGATGLIAIVASYFVDQTFGAGVMVPVVGAVLVIGFARSGPILPVLANCVSTFIGRLSYSLYLWHWPVIALPLAMGWVVPVWLSLAVTAALAAASYYGIETPTRHRRKIVPYVLGALAIVVALAVTMGNFPRYYDTAGFNKPVIYERYFDSNPHPLAMDERVWHGLEILPPHAPPGAMTEGGIRTGSGDPQLVMLGDSHGCFWAPIVMQTTEKLGVPASFWMINGVAPFFSDPPQLRLAGKLGAGEPLLYDQARIRLIGQWHPRVVIIAARWTNARPEWVRPCIDYLCQHADKVVLIEQPPELPMGDRNVLQYLAFKGFRPQTGVKQYYDAANVAYARRAQRLIKSLVAEHPNCSVIPIYDLYVKDGQAFVLDGKDVNYLDDDHLTFHGAQLAQRRIERAVTAALQSGPSPSGKD